MKIVAVSDLHGSLLDLQDRTMGGNEELVINPTALPSGDVLVIAGDVLPDDYHPPHREMTGSSRVVRQGWWFDEVWVPYLRHLKTKYKAVIWIGGNHDFFLQAIMSGKIKEAMPEGVFYLCEDGVEIEGVKFWGAPWNMTMGWAFAVEEKDYGQRLPYLPEDTDVLIVHGPPQIGGMPGVHWTSQILAQWITHTPTFKAVICGHIHEAYGKYHIKDVPVYVVSSKDRDYRLVNPPVEIEI